MNYIENVYICLSAPLVIAILGFKGKGRRLLLFLLCGMTVCLLSSYISTFFLAALKMDPVTGTITLTPMVEEIMKMFPLLFYLMVFEPGSENSVGCVLMVALGFATFENVCYMTQNGAASLLHLLIRGFGTGTMHVVCGTLLAIGLTILWKQLYLRIAGMFGLLSLSVTYHGIYNLLVSQQGAVAMVGYFVPIVSAFLIWIITLRHAARLNPREETE